LNRDPEREESRETDGAAKGMTRAPTLARRGNGRKPLFPSSIIRILRKIRLLQVAIG
jgi:hypothetical protein